MKLLRFAKYGLYALCVSGMLNNAAFAKNSHHHHWDKHYYGNNQHGYQISNRSYAKGRVINVVPIYGERNRYRKGNHKHCWLEPDPRHHRHHYNIHHRDKTIDTLAGAVIGGVIGNQFGSGSGRKIATVAGAAIGGSIANQSSNHVTHDKHREYENSGFIEVCDHDISYKKPRKRNIKGYQVTYRYKGNVYQSYTRRHPGKFIDLVVSVIPRE
ncbi:MAG: glycine zipper 2TM domain-containing protein [Pseudomonadota bacterium]